VETTAKRWCERIHLRLDRTRVFKHRHVSDIFISYASGDLPRVKPLVDALLQRGWSVWWDRTILPGKTWDKVIESALAQARCVIVLWSQDSIGSDWVRIEAEDAKQRGILVPALLDDVKIPLAFRRIQAARLIGWAGRLPSPAFDELAQGISEILSAASPLTPEGTIPITSEATISPQSGRWRSTVAMEAETIDRVKAGEPIGGTSPNPTPPRQQLNRNSSGTILFVHGNSVAFKDYQPTFRVAKRCAENAGLQQEFVACEWGDSLSMEFEGESIPVGPAVTDQGDEDEARWSYLYEDPLFELRVLADGLPHEASRAPGAAPAAEVLWNTIRKYQPTRELEALLDKSGLMSHWAPAWGAIVDPFGVVWRAIKASERDPDEAAMALADGLTAQLTLEAQEHGLPTPGEIMRRKLRSCLQTDWGAPVHIVGLRVKHFMAARLPRKRHSFSASYSPFIGDIILYMARGKDIREFLQLKIAELKPPVYLLAHNLGGVACVDLLALRDAPDVKALITAGSPAPLFYELDALASLKKSDPLPPGFPPWLNLYDPNDLLGYMAHRLFPQVRDVQIRSGELMPAANNAYWVQDASWKAIRQFIELNS
jgi:hypothetical protein